MRLLLTRITLPIAIPEWVGAGRTYAYAISKIPFAVKYFGGASSSASDDYPTAIRTEFNLYVPFFLDSESSLLWLDANNHEQPVIPANAIQVSIFDLDNFVVLADSASNRVLCSPILKKFGGVKAIAKALYFAYWYLWKEQAMLRAMTDENPKPALPKLRADFQLHGAAFNIAEHTGNTEFKDYKAKSVAVKVSSTENVNQGFAVQRIAFDVNLCIHTPDSFDIRAITAAATLNNFVYLPIDCFKQSLLFNEREVIELAVAAVEKRFSGVKLVPLKRRAFCILIEALTNSQAKMYCYDLSFFKQERESQAVSTAQAREVLLLQERGMSLVANHRVYVLGFTIPPEEEENISKSDSPQK
jgi:predicted 3-demethylubiquinone-9 3-methyltransferase (glyoxalase superfamily)